MKMPLKSNFLTSILIALLFGATMTVSCNSDKCSTIVCANGGYCAGGSCTCPIGYEGTNCETVSRFKFTGNWVVYEKGSASFAAQYPISIFPDSNNLITDVIIYNFNNYFKLPIHATVNNNNITIPNQQLEGKIVVGRGYIYTPDNVNYNQNSAITMYYEIIDTATKLLDDYGYDNLDDGSKPSAWNK